MTFPLSYWRGNSFIKRPAKVQAIFKAATFHLVTTFPFGDVQGDAIVRDAHRLTGVAMLLKVSRPPAVIGRVGTIVVDAVKGVSRTRLRPHIRREGFKGTQPAFTNRDASASVVWKSLPVWIKTSLLHRLPCAVFGSSLLVPRVSVFDERGMSLSVGEPQATARQRGAAAKRPFLKIALGAALAAATPERGVAIATSRGQNHPCSEAVPSFHSPYFTASVGQL